MVASSLSAFRSATSASTNSPASRRRSEATVGTWRVSTCSFSAHTRRLSVSAEYQWRAASHHVGTSGRRSCTQPIPLTPISTRRTLKSCRWGLVLPRSCALCLISRSQRRRIADWRSRIAMEQISYPQEALKKRATGVVVLTGVIRRDGQCAGLHLQETDVKAGEDTEWLVNVAFQDLRTWQFDAAERDDAVRVTYSFAVDASLPRGVAPQVEWVSPSQVKVRANPSE